MEDSKKTLIRICVFDEFLESYFLKIKIPSSREGFFTLSLFTASPIFQARDDSNLHTSVSVDPPTQEIYTQFHY